VFTGGNSFGNANHAGHHSVAGPPSRPVTPKHIDSKYLCG